MSNIQKTTKKGTSTNKSSKTPPTETITKETNASLQEALNLLKPLTDFHKAVEDANEDDIRLYWDVRLVRGEDTPFCHVKGSSSMPAMLAQKMRPHAPSKIQEEINDKILKPLLSVMMTEVERMTFADLAKRNQSGDFTNEEDCFQKALDEPPSKENLSPQAN